MALFGSKKNSDKSDKKEAKKAKSPVQAEDRPTGAKGAAKRDLSHVLKHPRITEKATAVSESSNVYVFDVSPRATKHDVIEAVRFFYKAEPVKVNMAKVPAKRVIVRGRRGVKTGGTKAYVYLKKGENIEII